MSNNTKARERHEHCLDRFYQVFAQMSAEIAELKRQLAACHQPQEPARGNEQ